MRLPIVSYFNDGTNRSYYPSSSIDTTHEVLDLRADCSWNIHNIQGRVFARRNNWKYSNDGITGFGPDTTSWN